MVSRPQGRPNPPAGMGGQNKRMPADALKVTVVGHQWWWEFRYPDLGIVTANELHVPLSTDAKAAHTSLRLESADVAHSFWVAQLAGKTDLIPGITNTMWIEPRQEGTFLGNCAEYCGTQHANMLLRVIAQPEADFKQWVAAQQKPQADDAAAAEGKRAFESLSCVNCHAIRGTIAKGNFGPDLTHLTTRETLAAGVIANTPENLKRWVNDPQEVKPGCLMPSMKLTDNELTQVVAYLESLK